MTKIEVLIIHNAARAVNFKDCKQCEHYRHIDGKSQCHITTTEGKVDDCLIASRDIYESH